MWAIFDLISGEVIELVSKEKAISETQKRLEQHNKEYSYSHRGKHYSQNATYVVYDDEHKIEIIRG